MALALQDSGKTPHLSLCGGFIGFLERGATYDGTYHLRSPSLLAVQPPFPTTSDGWEQQLALASLGHADSCGG